MTRAPPTDHAHSGGFRWANCQYSEVQVAVAQSSLTTIAPYMFWLMFRNVASDGFVFEDPENTHALSQPGCVLASPSWENTATNVKQELRLQLDARRGGRRDRAGGGNDPH